MSVFYLGAHHPHWLWRATFPLFISHHRLAGRRSPAAASGVPVGAGLGRVYRTVPARPVDHPRRAIRRGDRPVRGAGRTAGLRRPAGLDVRTAHSRPHRPVRPRAPGPHRGQLPGAAGAGAAPAVHPGGAGLAARGLPALRADVPGGRGRPGPPAADRRRVGVPPSPPGRSPSSSPRWRPSGCGCGFGIKTSGLHRYGHLLASADSMAWSYSARRAPALSGCTGHRNCANCLTYDTTWRQHILAASAARGCQPGLFDPDPVEVAA